MTNRYCFLHVGKTGGSTIKKLIRAHKKRNPSALITIKAYKHNMNLARARKKFPPDDKLFFFVRDPVQRFVSGFNSRLRQGRPKHDNPWQPGEEIAFRRFPVPNALAEALGSSDSDTRAAAKAAMHDIGHLRLGLTYYLGSVSLLEKMANRICFIGDLASFNQDLVLLRQVLNIDPDVAAPTDDVNTHRTPAHMDQSLSDTGARNVREWYAKDYVIYEWCVQRRRAMLPHVLTRV